MLYGAGYVAATQEGASSFVDSRPYAVGSIAETFERYPNVGSILPAMGYGDSQQHELEARDVRAQGTTAIPRSRKRSNPSSSAIRSK